MLVKGVACLDCRVQTVHLVGMEYREDLVHQVLLDFLEGHQRSVKRSLSRPAILVPRESRDLRDHLEMLAALDNLVIQVATGMTGLQDHRVHLDRLDLQVTLGGMVHEAILDDRHLAHPQFLGIRAHREILDHLVYLEMLARVDGLVRMDYRVHRVLQDHLDRRDCQENLGLRDNLGSLDPKENEEYVPNIAHWTEECFSKTVQEDEKYIRYPGSR